MFRSLNGRFRPQLNWQRIVSACGLLGLAAAAFVIGRIGIASRATAVPPQPAPSAQPQQSPSDYSRRAVAYIYGTQIISREDLGEYLIARQGADKLDLLVNKMIIESACKKRGITVTAAEVEEEVQKDVQAFKLNMKDYEQKVLKPRGMSLYELREDAIRPRLALTKLCRDRVQVTEKDILDAYEAYHGEKIQGRMIMFPKGEQRLAMKLYDKLRSSEEEFQRQAQTQASPSLAAQGGKFAPFGRNFIDNKELERAAFSLQPGEVSQIVGTPEGEVIFKCDARIPPDGTKLEDVRATLVQAIMEKKISDEMRKVAAELRKEANPKLFLTKVQKQEEWLEEIRRLDAEAERLSGPAANVGPRK